MKQYIKDGKILPASHIIIYTENAQIFNPTEEMILEDGWVEYVTPQPTQEELLQKAKQNKIDEILAYDSSSEVNEFYIQGMPVWLDKATRAGLVLRFQAELENAKTETTLWYNNMQFPLNLDVAMKMLFAIELYASACYDNTQAHIAAIDKMLTTEEVEVYDYHTGYPEKLNF